MQSTKYPHKTTNYFVTSSIHLFLHDYIKLREPYPFHFIHNPPIYHKLPSIDKINPIIEWIS